MAPYTLDIRCPLPPHIPPEFTVGRIKEFTPLMDPHPFLVQYQRRRVAVEDVVSDNFFSEQGTKIEAYAVTERIKFMFIPFNTQIFAVFQGFDRGARCRADASAGVRVKSTFSVEPAANGAGWDFVEHTNLECSAFLSMFVKMNLREAHEDICKRFIEQTVNAYQAVTNGTTAG